MASGKMKKVQSGCRKNFMANSGKKFCKAMGNAL